MGWMHVVLLQMEHPIVVIIDLTGHVQVPLVVRELYIKLRGGKYAVLRQIKHPIVLPIVLTVHVHMPNVVREPFLK